MFKTIVLFNHKGGVSKTTTTYNIAWKLTQHQKNVLLVDGDPQCNLTGLFLGDYFDEYYESENTRENNIKDAVSSAFEGRPQPIEAIECPLHKANKRLRIIPGHMDLSEYESSLNFSLSSNAAYTVMQNLPGSFYELIKKCAEKYDSDYVFIDMNPGLSALNEVFFIYCDGFIVPTNPDPFALMAMKTLSKTLPKWKKVSENSSETFAKSSYPIPQTKMLFLGEIIQRFNIRNGVAARPYQGRITEIKEYVNDDFVKVMKKNQMLITDEKKIQNYNYCLGEIPDFGSLIQKANKVQKPVLALTADEIGEVGTVFENLEKKRKTIDSLFESIAEVIINNL